MLWYPRVRKRIAIMNPCFHESIHADFFLVIIFNHYFVDKSIGLYIKLILFETLSVRVVETLLFSGRMIEANNLNVVDGNVISLQLFRLFVSLNLVSLKVMPCACHCGICSGFPIIFEGITASSTCAGIMELSQKFDTLSIFEDFHLFDFFNGYCNSFRLVLFNSCCFVSFVFSSFLLIH